MQKHDVPTQPRPLPDGPLYFVGIGGAGQSAIAYVLAQRGRTIRGADPGISAASRARLELVGITVYSGHDATQVGDAAAVIATDAVNETNPEIVEARKRNIPVFRRPEALGTILNAGRGIAIAGTHGKTTTTGMVASILMAAGLDPTILIGGDLPLIGGNARNGSSDIVLAEACEAYGGFLYLYPEIAVILNVEPDHLDYHGTAEQFYEAFERFIAQVRPKKGTKDRRNGAYPYVVVCAEDEKAYELARKDEMARVQTPDERIGVFYYGLDDSPVKNMKEIAALRIEADGRYSNFEVWFDTEGPLKVRLGVPGVHNVLNALAAISVATALGIDPQIIPQALESFTGTGRRFERIGEANGILVVDDYAHHPTEIRATLAAARSAYPDRRLVAIFQPHLYSRTRDFMDDFAESLTAADVVYLTDIYKAREELIPGVSSETLTEKVRAVKPDLSVVYVPDKSDLPERLAADVQQGDLVLTMGAGDIRNAGEGLYQKLLSKTDKSQS